MEFLANAMRKRGLDMRVGLMHALGADPRSRNKDGLTMNWFGRDFLFNEHDFLPPMSRTRQSMNPLDKMVAVGSIPMTLFTAIGGFMEGGILGAAKATLIEVGLNSALVKHAYASYDEAGVTKFTPGKFTNARLLRKMGAPGMLMATGLNLGSFLSKYYWGSTVGAAFDTALGGGVIGTAGALIGGSLGVRHSGKLSVAAGAYYGGKAIAMGGYTILKAGYNHQQMQRAINTDGDMAAFMTQGAFTMRERAVQAIAKSHLNARSALGQEAQLMSTPSRSYFSPYRRFY